MSQAIQTSEETEGVKEAGPGIELNEQDRLVLTNVESSLENGLALLEWWKEADEKDAFNKKFHLTQVKNRDEEGYSFFGDADLLGKQLPVMGDVPELFYDRPKAKKVKNWQDQVREFALRYFMRISAFQLPEPIIEDDECHKQGSLEALSLCPKDHVVKLGFGFEQIYYKPYGGTVKKFAKEDRFKVIDVRSLFDKYEWVVANVSIFNFNVRLPSDPNLPGLQIPFVGEEAKVILHKGFATNTDQADSSLYSFGYATLKSAETEFLAYGPSSFDAGFQVFQFHVKEDGEIRVRMPFCVNRPTKLVNLPLNPLEWGLMAAKLITPKAAEPWLAPLQAASKLLPFANATFDPTFPSISLLNQLTGGMAARDYCVSKEGVEKILLIQHFNQYYTMLMGSLLTWRQVEDWSKPECVPTWVKEGRDVRPD